MRRSTRSSGARASSGRTACTGTRRENAAMILVAPKARRFAVIGDRALHERVGDAFWNGVVDDSRPTSQRDEMADGIVLAIERLGERALHGAFRTAMLVPLRCSRWHAALPAIAADFTIPPAPTRYVTDGAGALSSAGAQRARKRTPRFRTATGHQIVVWIGNSTGDVPLETWTVEPRDQWKVGRKGYDDGAMLFVFMKDHKVRIEVGYGLEGKLTDATSSRIINDAIVRRCALATSTAPFRAASRRCLPRSRHRMRALLRPHRANLANHNCRRRWRSRSSWSSGSCCSSSPSCIIMQVVGSIRYGYLVLREGSTKAQKDMKRWLFWGGTGFGRARRLVVGGGGGFGGGVLGRRRRFRRRQALRAGRGDSSGELRRIDLGRPRRAPCQLRALSATSLQSRGGGERAWTPVVADAATEDLRLDGREGCSASGRFRRQVSRGRAPSSFTSMDRRRRVGAAHRSVSAHGAMRWRPRVEKALRHLLAVRISAGQFYRRITKLLRFSSQVECA